MKSGVDEQVAKVVWASILENIEAVSQPIYESVNPPASEDEINQFHSGMSYEDVIAQSFEVFSHEILKHLETNRYTVVFAFDDLYFV